MKYKVVIALLIAAATLMSGNLNSQVKDGKPELYYQLGHKSISWKSPAQLQQEFYERMDRMGPIYWWVVCNLEACG